MKTAKDIMTRDLITVTPSTPLSQLARIFSEDQISGCPVVTVDGRLVGIVSKTDLLARVIEGGHDFSENEDYRRLLGLGEEDVDGGVRASDTEIEELGQVDDIMQPEVISVAPDVPLPQIAARMHEHRIHRVAVTKDGKLLGIVTSLDLLGHFPQKS